MQGHTEMVSLLNEFLSLSLCFKPFKVLATETVSHKALDADIYSAIPTEKVDGTCCYVTTYKGKRKLLQILFIT